MSNESAHVVHDNTSRCRETEHACRARHHYMQFTSPRFAVGIHIPQRRVVLEVGFSRPCGKFINRTQMCLKLKAIFRINIALGNISK